MSTEPVIVVGDVGGTNTTIALMAPEGDSFRIVYKRRYASQQLSGIEEAIQDSLERFRTDHPKLELRACCFSAAGPVRENQVKLTNVPWTVNGEVISEYFRMPAFVINDFTAVCYGLPLMQLGDPEQVAPLPHPDGSMPRPHGDIMAAAGAGTGLGVGFLLSTDNIVRAFPTEAGHVDISPVDNTMKEFYRFLEDELQARPGAELAISGKGINNLFRFFHATTDASGDRVIEGIATAAPHDRPPLISAAAADGHPLCTTIMQYFVRMYANFASNVAISYIPEAGLFLAGGIAAKNERFFTEDHLFMRTFLENYNPNIRTVIDRIPVYILKNYDVSLFGAANAARMLKG